MDTQEYIRQNILATRKKQIAAKKSVLVPEERSNFLTIFLAVCILLVSLASLFTMFTLSQDNLFVSDVPVITEESKQKSDEPNEEIHAWVSDVNTRLDNYDSRLKIQEYRLWLVALANNENANVDSRFHRNGGHITIDGDWKLSRSPRTMTLTEEQKDYLENGPTK